MRGFYLSRDFKRCIYLPLAICAQYLDADADCVRGRLDIADLLN